MRYAIFCGMLFAVGVIVGLSACHHSPASIASEDIPDTVSYNFNIRPILSDKCFKCHGPDANKRQANLRLDIPESAYSVLKDNPKAHALVPGDPGASEVYRRITTSDSNDMMPSVKSNLKPLNAIQEVWRW